MNQHRVLPGTPSGGQFAPGIHDESGTRLDPDASFDTSGSTDPVNTELEDDGVGGTEPTLYDRLIAADEELADEDPAGTGRQDSPDLEGSSDVDSGPVYDNRHIYIPAAIEPDRTDGYISPEEQDQVSAEAAAEAAAIEANLYSARPAPARNRRPTQRQQRNTSTTLRLGRRLSRWLGRTFDSYLSS